MLPATILNALTLSARTGRTRVLCALCPSDRRLLAPYALQRCAAHRSVETSRRGLSCALTPPRALAVQPRHLVANTPAQPFRRGRLRDTLSPERLRCEHRRFVHQVTLSPEGLRRETHRKAQQRAAPHLQRRVAQRRGHRLTRLQRRVRGVRERQLC